jgi:hypothetical protein
MFSLTFKRLPVVLALGLALGAGTPGADELTADAAVIRDGAMIAPLLRSSEPRMGDLYWATMIKGKMWFFSEGGWTEEPLAWMSAVNIEGDLTLFEFPSDGVEPGKYALFVFTTDHGADPADFRNWHGGLGGVKRLNFSINESREVSTDMDGNGWPEDDRNKDGYSDDDRNYDGWHDDDHDKDGLHDDDINEDGYHDDDYDLDGYHDEDYDLDGFYDDDYDHDGVPDDEEDHDSEDDVNDDSDDDSADDSNDDSADDSIDESIDDSDGDSTDDSDDDSIDDSDDDSTDDSPDDSIDDSDDGDRDDDVS